MPVPAGFFSVSMRLSNAALVRPAAVTYGCERADALDPIANANLILSLFQTHVGPVLDSAVTIGPATCHLGSTSGESFAVLSTTTPGVGGAALQSPTPNVAALIRKQTDRGGRRGRGRMYLPWFANETDLDEAGVIATTRANTLTSAFTAWVAAHLSNDVPLAVLHEPGISPTGDPSMVLSMFCDRVVATQRRRLVRTA